jgi:tetratricopeptide (TPR) repeat protein
MSRRPRGAVAPLFCGLLTVGLLGGCVYYNGMYNANRLAKSARKAEREGRTFDANNLWGQVATKAESVVVRHPSSKYADEAAVLRGLALSRLGQCEQGLRPLSRASLLRGRSDLAEDALLAAGRCQLALGNVAAADAAFIQVLESKSSDRRIEAHYQHARVARQAGRYEEALSALEGVHDPHGDSERLLALAGTGRGPEALALADSLMARGDTTTPWDSLLVALGRQDPAGASRLVDRMRHLPNRAANTQAGWLVEDGLRLLPSDTARAAARFREAAKVGGEGEAAGRAALQLVRLDLSRAARAEDLPPFTQKLKDLASQYQATSAALSQLGVSVAGVLAATSVPPQSPQGDLRIFLGAEAARDTLAARQLASALFRRIPDGWPDSPYAPKAILAAQQLDSVWTDSARALLEERYLGSPYLAVVRGEATPEYRQLEDSLGAFAARLVPAARRAPADGRAPPRRDDDDEPGRPQPAPSDRVVEPR